MAGLQRSVGNRALGARLACQAPAAQAPAGNLLMRKGRHEPPTRKADAGTRTPDPFITSEVLYQLSYVGATGDASGGSCSTRAAACDCRCATERRRF
jgi:hypothetical protein